LAPERKLKEDDVTRHLAFAFSGFLGRQAAKEGLDKTKKEEINSAKELISQIFELPQDESLKVSRNLEIIFMLSNRREITVPVVVKPVEPEATTEAEKEETEVYM
jgi:hypothetical protein